MSRKTFNMSTDKVESIVSVPHRGLDLDPSPSSHYSNSFRSLPLYTNSSNSNLGDREGNSYPDINVQEYCITERSPVDCNTTSPQSDLISPLSVNLNQTFIATPVDGSMNFWNENLSLMHEKDTGIEKYKTFQKNTADGSSSLVMSPDSSGRESQMSSCEISRRGSLENSSYSLSSGEMVIRSKTSGLEDQSVLAVSSLDETSISPAVDQPALPVSSNRLSTTLPDVCEKLEMTFVKPQNWEFSTEDEITPNSHATLPNKDKIGLLMTFVCETSSEDGGTEATFPSETDLMPHCPAPVTPEEGSTFVSTLSSIQETEKDSHTSTPLQIIGNKISSLPSFSPFTGSSPGLNQGKQQPASVTPKQHVVAGMEIGQMEVIGAPNLDFSGIDSKVEMRTGPQMVPSPVSQFRPSSNTDINKGPATGTCPTKLSNTLTQDSTTMVSIGQSNKGVGNVGVTAIELGNQRLSAMDPVSNAPNSEIKSCDSRTEAVQNATEKHACNQTFCYNSLQRSPDRRLKQGISGENDVKSSSTSAQHKQPVLKTRLRFSSDSSSSSTRQAKEKRITSSSNISKDLHPSQTRALNLNSSSQNKKLVQTEATNRQTKNSSREVRRISLVAESIKSISQGSSWNDTKSKCRGIPSPKRRGSPLLQSPAANPRPATLSARQKQGTLGKDDYKMSRAIGTPQSRLKNTIGTQRVQAAGGSSVINGSAASTRHQFNGSQTPQTPIRALMGPPPTPSSKIPRKTPRPFRNPAEAGETGEGTRTLQVSGGAANKSTPLKSVLKARNITTPGKSTQPALATSCKPSATTSKQVLSSTVGPLSRITSAKLAYPCVDKIKSKTGSFQQRHQQQATQSNHSNRPPDVVPANVAEAEKKNHKIQQLQGLLAASNCRFEAITIVLQQTLAKSDEVTRQSRELSQELVNLRGELVCSVHSSELLEAEKEELRVTLEDALQKLQEQHQKDLTELEQRLHVCYQAEWDKLHRTYQEEADKCKALMQQQMGELKSTHEALNVELQNKHAEQLQSVRQQYEASIEELRAAHSDELQVLGNSLKNAEASLSGQIQELTVENNALIEKLTADENMRKEMAEKSQKDSHTLYLEQELESLKVVLDIKNKQLHQQEKKLVELDKLTEKNVKLDESLKKVQQENEDLKARMEKHAALSRQLSTEQAVLQDSLQKESKVNKRLSMENEELLWKLHNGDLGSPRKVSPTSTSPMPSPSHSFSLQSPHSPSMFSSSPISPR